MKHPVARRILSFLVTLSVALSALTPAAAAQSLGVDVENHTQADGRTPIANVRVDGVLAPAVGAPLDGAATVTADPGVTWEVPVLWVGDDLALATVAEDGRAYLPVISFYVPEGYTLAGDSFAVVLSDSLTALFGGREIVSVYVPATGITYILPASLRGLVGARSDADDMAPRREAEDERVQESESEPDPASAPSEPVPMLADGARGDSDQERQGSDQDEKRLSVVDIHCAQSAKDVLADEDLEWFVDLVINRLEPQAVNLLVDSFPAFREASENDELGRQIGLYIYFASNDMDDASDDKDDAPEDDRAPADAFAYVRGEAVKIDGVYKYCYMLGINAEDLLVRDEDDEPVRDAATGKFRLVHDGEKMTTLENTLVHELFHALMDDYNRTGMAGVTNINDFVLDADGKFPTEELTKRYQTLHFPTWFVEGSASAVENDYQLRKKMFDGLRTDDNGKKQDSYTADVLVNRYAYGMKGSDPVYYDLSYSTGIDEEGMSVDNTAPAYVSGYLATLYLADLACIRNTGTSAITHEGESVTSVDAERLREGLSSILERMHKGETLDQVIADISPVGEDGAKLYRNTNDFESKFIKGSAVGRSDDGPQYAKDGDGDSTAFVTDYLNYVLCVGGQEGRTNDVNGSILRPIDEDYANPLDATKESSSDVLKVVDSDKSVESTVPDSVALAGGGKSDPDALAAPDAPQQATDGDKGPAPSEAREASDAVDDSDAEADAEGDKEERGEEP